MIDFLFWYVSVSLVGWITFPFAFRYLSFLPDKGFSLSRSLGLLLCGYIFWILNSFNILQNNAGGVIISIFLLAGLSYFSLKGEYKLQVINYIKNNKTRILIVEIIFLLAFAVWSIVRAANPEIHGTEKPMELAFINAILRSPAFPPNDPWLSGYSISYYYFGYLIIAMIVHLTATPTAVAFNLAISLIFGLTAISAYGIVFNLLQKTFAKEELNQSENKNEKPTKEKLCIFSALLGPVYLLFVSNIEGFLEMLHARGLLWFQNASGSMGQKFWNWLNILELKDPPSFPLSWQPARASGYWWWRASRVLQDFDFMGQSKEIIDEFPFFSFLLADLHAHVIAIPFVLLAVSISYHQILNGKLRESSKFDLFTWISLWMAGEGKPINALYYFSRFRNVDFWITAIAFGALAFLNIWDFPICVALFCCLEIITQIQSHGWSIQRVFEFIETGLIIGIIGFCLYIPFYLGFSSQAGGILPSLIYFTRGIYFWIMFAPLILPILVWLLWDWKNSPEYYSLRKGIITSVLIVFGLWVFSFLLGLFVLSSPQLNTVYSSLQGAYPENALDILIGAIVRRVQQPGTWITLMVMLVPVLGSLTIFTKNEITREISSHTVKKNKILEEHDTRKPTSFVTVLILIGIGLVLIPEFFYLKDQFGWRMNTIFKFYYQAWIFWGIAAAYASVVLLRKLGGIWQIIFSIGWTLLITASLVYPFFGVLTKTNGFQPTEWTLDGSNYLVQSSPDEMEAIMWLKRAPLGIVSEAIGGSYSNYARVSTYSGQPTVLGWPGHESQWRGGAEEMGTREQDIQKLYVTSNWDETKSIIERYNIRYVFLGMLERSKYHVNETKFNNHLKRVFETGDVIIYEIPKWNSDIDVDKGL